MTSRTWWQTYTPRNIAAEIAFRWARRRIQRASTHDDRPSLPPYDGGHARSVGHFYDAHHDAFLSVYGDVIQAFRTREVRDLLDYEMRGMGVAAGQRVLDAGCGVGAPAVYFARHAEVEVDAITISASQFAAACQRVATEQLEGRVRIVLGDYHRLDEYFPVGAYDVVCFLESFGHSRDKTRVIDVCWKMLKPGGVLYIKDLFARVPLQPDHRQPIAREIARINDAYRYQVGDLNGLLDAVRGKGFIVDWLRSVDLPLAAFEDLAISNQFQELTGIARIDNWGEYIFPVDFFELKCRRPAFEQASRLDRHVLQNLYHRSERGHDSRVSSS